MPPLPKRCRRCECGYYRLPVGVGVFAPPLSGSYTVLACTVCGDEWKTPVPSDLTPPADKGEDLPNG